MPRLFALLCAGYFLIATGCSSLEAAQDSDPQELAYNQPRVNEIAARRLSAPVGLREQTYTLVEIGRGIQRQTGVPVRFQWDGLAEIGIEPEREIEVQAGAIPADRLLATLLLELAPPGSPMDWEIYPTYLLVDGTAVIGTNRSLQPLTIAVDWPDGGPRVIDADEAVRRQLRGQTIAIANDAMSLAGMFELLRTSTDLQFQVDWQQLELVGIDQDSLVTITVDAMLAEDLLDAVLRQVSAEQFDDDKAGYYIKGGVIHITTRGEISGDVETRVYDVRDLVSRPYGPLLENIYAGDDFALAMLQDFQLAWLFDLGSVRRVFDLNDALGSSSGEAIDHAVIERTWQDVVSQRTDALDHLSQLIQDTTGDPDDWLDGDAMLTELNGNFIINANAQVHAEIDVLLERLREKRADSVSLFMREVDVARLLLRCESLRAEGNYKAALQEAEAALNVDPASVPARAMRDVLEDTIARRDSNAE